MTGGLMKSRWMSVKEFNLKAMILRTEMVKPHNMGAYSTVVFADLTGSTRVFEAMGNARATDTVTRLKQ